MSFEHVVLSVATDVARHSSASFFNGTLFVENVSKEDAVRILNNIRHYAYADTIMSEVGDEFAYDFV